MSMTSEQFNEAIAGFRAWSIAREAKEIHKQASKTPVAKCETQATKREKTDMMISEQETESQKRNYLHQRSWNIHLLKDHELRQQFGLIDDDSPRTPAETVKRIQDGKFVLDEGTKDRFGMRLFDVLRWRDPDKKEDPKGYAKAEKSLNKVDQETADVIHIQSPEEGLKAIKEFETWKYQA